MVFFIPFIILSLFFIIVVYYHSNKIRDAIESDLSINIKIIAELVVWKKAKAFKGDAHFIWTDSDLKNLFKIKIEKEDFDRIKLKQKITVEYVEKSKRVLNIDLNLGN